MPPARHVSAASVIGVIIIAGLLRLAWLETVPPGINQDEAVHAYEAYCLRVTGGDHFGARWPSFFRAYGRSDHHSAPFIYLLAAVQVVFGMTVWSTRFLPAVFGILNVWFVYLLVKRFYDHRAGLAAALLLAVSPWHVHLARLAFEVSICPPMITLGLVLLARGMQPKKGEKGPDVVLGDVIPLVVAGLIFGVTLWTYNAMRIFVPLLLAAGAIVYGWRIRTFAKRPRGPQALAALVAGFLVGVAPFLLACLKTPEKAWGRASTEFILNRTSGPAEAVVSVARTYAVHLSPAFLFLTGDPSIIQSIPGYGQLHYYCALLLPLGLYRVLRRWRTERFVLFVLLWLLVVPVAPAITELEGGHSLRAAGMLPAVQILAALGLGLVLDAARRRTVATHQLAIAAAGIVIGLNAAYFIYLFAVRYPPAAYRVFQAEWVEVVGEVQRRRHEYDHILLTQRRTNQVGMLYLFWSKTHPDRYFAMPRRIEEGERWDRILGLGNVYFLPSTMLAKILPQLPSGSKILVAERPDVPVAGRELKRFYYPDGSVAVILYHVET